MNSKKGLKIFNKELKSKIEENYNNKIIELRQYNNGTIGAFFKNGKFRFIGGKLSDEEKKKRAAKKKAKQEEAAKKKAKKKAEKAAATKKKAEKAAKKKAEKEAATKKRAECKKLKKVYDPETKECVERKKRGKKAEKAAKKKAEQAAKKKAEQEAKKAKKKAEQAAKKKAEQAAKKKKKQEAAAKKKAEQAAKKKAEQAAKKKKKQEAAAKKKAEKEAIVKKKAECKEKKMKYDKITKDCVEKKKKARKPKKDLKVKKKKPEFLYKKDDIEEEELYDEYGKLIEGLKFKIDNYHLIQNGNRYNILIYGGVEEIDGSIDASMEQIVEYIKEEHIYILFINSGEWNDMSDKDKKILIKSGSRIIVMKSYELLSPKKNEKPKPKNKIPKSCQNFNQIEIQSGWEPLGDIDTKFLIMLNVKDSENNDWKMCYNLIDLKEYINSQIKEKRKDIYLSIYRNEKDAAPALPHLLAEKERDYSKMIKLNDKLLTKIKKAYNSLLKKNRKEVIKYYNDNIGGTEEEIIKKLPFAELIDCDKEWKKKKNNAKIPCQYDRLVSAVISDHEHMIAFHIIHKSNLKILKDKYKHIDNGIHLDQKMYKDIISRSKWTIEMPSVGFKYTDVNSNDYKYFKNNNKDKENYMNYCDLDSSQRPANVIITLNKLWDENKLLKYKNRKWIFNLEKMIGNHKNYKNKIGLEYFNNRNEESKLTRQILEEGGVLPAGTKNKDIVNGGLGKWVSLSKKYDNSFDRENPDYSFYQLWKSFANTLNYMEYHESAELLI